MEIEFHKLLKMSAIDCGLGVKPDLSFEIYSIFTFDSIPRYLGFSVRVFIGAPRALGSIAGTICIKI